MISVNSPRFNLGQVVATPASIAKLQRHGKSVMEYIERHAKCDFGDLSVDDVQANEDALVDGGRILSSYVLEGEGDDATKIWIITEAEDEAENRLATTVLLPEEY